MTLRRGKHMRVGKTSFWGIVALLVLSICAVSVAAVPVNVTQVKINGDEISPSGGEIREFEKGADSLEVKVFLTGLADVKDVEVMAMISGYEYGDFEPLLDRTHVFDIESGVQYIKTLRVPLPIRMEESRYRLRIFVTDRNNANIVVMDYVLNVDPIRHAIVIEDVVFTPERRVQAGRALLATVRLQNFGETDEKGIKVRVAVPELEISASDYIDELEAGEETTSEELYLRIPECAKEGDYDVIVTVQFDEGYERIQDEYSIEVVESESCPLRNARDDDDTSGEGRTIISVGPESQQVRVGAGGAIWQLSLTNEGDDAKTYTVLADANGWGTVRVSPSNVVVVEGGETKSVFLYVTANNNAPLGRNLMTVTVKSADKTLKELTLQAEVVGEAPQTSRWAGLKKGLEVGLVVLVVLLVILGLIIGFNRMKGSEDEKKDDQTQTYY